MAENTLLAKGDHVTMVLIENAVAFGDASDEAVEEYRRTVISYPGDCDVLMMVMPAGRGGRLRSVLWGLIRRGGAITGGEPVLAGANVVTPACPNDSDGDGHCGRRGCSFCGGPPR